MPSLSDISVDVFLDNLLPVIDVADLLNLSSTNRFFAILGADETFWRRRLYDDFNFSGASTARTSSWKTIYKGMSRPRVYTWGQKRNGRLGITQFPATTLNDVPYPVRVRIPGVRIVNLVAGGTSFHALDSQGNVYAWGTLDGEGFGLRGDGLSSPSAQIDAPHKLSLPLPIRSINCGRFHVACLDSEDQIWNMVNWGRPFRLVCDYITAAKSPVTQVECGWRFSSMLNQAGDIFVWFPYDEIVEQAIEEHRLANKANKIFATSTHEIPCATWDLKQDSFKLPALTDLPPSSTSSQSKDIKVVKIAAFDNNLIALTNYGHVLKFDGLANGATAKNGHWTYLPKFSEAAEVKQHQVFSTAQEHEGGLRVSETMQITHISAHFQSFVAYSTGPTSVVIMGNADMDAYSTPKVIPELQNIGVISVVLGDYHFGALTEAGKLLTWGQYSEGALGLGDPARIPIGEGGGFSTEQHLQAALSRGRGRPLDVTVPTEVRFDHEVKGKRDMYCFAATASGWHMGALAIDLERHSGDDDDDDDESDEHHMPGHFDAEPSPPQSSGNVPVPGGHPSFATRGFRVGFAGRGMMRGGPHRRGL